MNTDVEYSHDVLERRIKVFRLIYKDAFEEMKFLHEKRKNFEIKT